MTIYPLENQGLHVLIVTCASDFEETRFPAMDTDIEYFVVPSKDVTNALTAEARLDYVIAMFDPVASKSVKELRVVARVAALANVRMCTVGACNADWIDGLMDDCGSIRHFWSFPSADNIRNLRHY